MRRGIVVLTILSLAGCFVTQFSSPGSSADGKGETVQSSDSPPEPKDPPEARQSQMVVTDSALEYAPGDTVYAALDQSYRTDSGQAIPIYTTDGEQRLGAISGSILGPLSDGAIVVIASVLNVRACPSTKCQVVGQLSRGEKVTAKEYQQGWYRLAESDGESDHFAHADYFVIPKVYRHQLLKDIRARTRQFYNQRLSSMRAYGRGSVFTDWSVTFEGRTLRFRFYSHFIKGPPLRRVCDGMDEIADFVEALVSETSSTWIPSYSAGVYAQVRQTRKRSQYELAALTDGGAIVCNSPY